MIKKKKSSKIIFEKIKFVIILCKNFALKLSRSFFKKKLKRIKIIIAKNKRANERKKNNSYVNNQIFINDVMCSSFHLYVCCMSVCVLFLCLNLYAFIIVFHTIFFFFLLLFFSFTLGAFSYVKWCTLSFSLFVLSFCLWYIHIFYGMNWHVDVENILRQYMCFGSLTVIVKSWKERLTFDCKV